METLTFENKYGILRACGMAPVEKATSSLCTCCGVLNPQKNTAKELYDGNKRKGIWAYKNRLYMSFTSPEDVREIEDTFEGIVIPDVSGNLTIQWRDE